MSARVFLVAAEASGDALGADLARELREQRPGVEIIGVGGAQMAAAGVPSLADIRGLAVLGFVDGLLAYARVKRAVAATAEAIAVHMIENMDVCDSVKLYCGVLPQNPKPPFNYKLTFNMEGLVTEYDFEAVVLRDGEIHMVPTLTEVEDLHIDQLGDMEAFVTSGGTSTAPYTLQGKVTNYEYKTIRHPGHAEKMRLYKDFGLWREDKINVKGCEVSPKDVFNAVFGPELAKFEDLDLCAVRGVGVGTKNGQPCRIQIDIFDRQCEDTGFTSMERLTGFSTAIIAQEVVQGRVAKGAVRYENAMTGTSFLRELKRRHIDIRVQETMDADLS